MSGFDDLLAEGAAVPTEGWDFSWFAGRATEQRPSWGYARLLAGRLAAAESVLDVQTGGGEVLAFALTSAGATPPVLAATEEWQPNVPIARRALAPFGGGVVEVAATADLPFPADRFDLVVSRHPVLTRWDEVRRVLRPGGTYLSQQVGSGSVRELTEFMMGSRQVSVHPDLGPYATTAGASPVAAVTSAEAAGLDVVDVRQEALRMEFHDIAAVVHFLRKVIWIVPDFTVPAYRGRLALLHDFIERHGPFVAHAQRFLIEARAGAAAS
ncbi:class I SAM-dependent methyltransferase [Actinacidiphila acididurans]|uniref:Class I SAM-dependent methyltransferase n=1 Tax=Actinacidiphila acididurans TaxID=2784346 RepID=A0ABS2TQR5_9ACTN|nr:class I SAM-dependent methyltransferase [Actinacidiphila acididurans]MBM9504308.1 class I SAM-dependent methyltransferase [Actinacidiphila acididurans]